MLKPTRTQRRREKRLLWTSGGTGRQRNALLILPPKCRPGSEAPRAEDHHLGPFGPSDSGTLQLLSARTRSSGSSPSSLWLPEVRAEQATRSSVALIPCVLLLILIPPKLPKPSHLKLGPHPNAGQPLDKIRSVFKKCVLLEELVWANSRYGWLTRRKRGREVYHNPLHPKISLNDASLSNLSSLLFKPANKTRTTTTAWTREWDQLFPDPTHRVKTSIPNL